MALATIKTQKRVGRVKVQLTLSANVQSRKDMHIFRTREQKWPGVWLT